MKNLILSSICLALVMPLVAFRTAKPLAPVDVTELTISKIHLAYKMGQFTSEQLVAAYLDRISQFDKQINSITTINPDALSIAKELDKEYKRTKVLRPLHGIPIIVKDNINTKGLPTTAGAISLQNFAPDTDAFIIEKLVKAGAIIIAKSNMAEWAFSPSNSFSSLHGTTLNPYNLEYTPAGSSGGTAASVAANFGAIGLGTDTGGSILGPSSHCSLVGFRTTIGLISRAGIIPLYLNNDVVGPMCRTVEDAVKVLEIMVGYDPSDPVTKQSEGKTHGNYIQFLQKQGLMGARIGVLRELSDLRRIAFRKAIEDQMDKLKLDALVYPTWINKPAEIISSDKDNKGNNNQIIAPHTGQPAFTVPMGFSKGNLPAGIQFLGRMYAEPTLIRLAYSYEQGTKHRVSPVIKK